VNRTTLLGSLAIILTIVGLRFVQVRLASDVQRPDRSEAREAKYKGLQEDCGPPLTAASLDTSLALGTAFLLNNQLPEGNFHYLYDWQARADVPGEDSEVRQAGASWGVALIHQERPTPETAAAVRRALAFWAQRTQRSEDGRAWVTYGEAKRGSTGTNALVALTHLAWLASPDPTPEERATSEAALRGLLAQLVAARQPSGLFAGTQDNASGEPSGPPVPYYDGEALLALARAARAGRPDLLPVVFEAAEAGYQQRVVKPRQDNPDPADTKAYYQWSSLAWWELLQTEDPRKEPYAERLMALAVWMIDDHLVLSRTRNTGYAFEGILPAWQVAQARQDPRADKFACVIRQGLRKLTGWQVGHPEARGMVADAPPTDPRARGGIQNHKSEPGLRIDTTQHQMHAVLLARRWLVTEAE
jgi:UDP-N-acetylmuramoyl-tripeptide--D-alanyl-D-alanine ligase